jgi:hypothetical protein
MVIQRILLTLLFLLLGTYQQAVFGNEELRFALLIGNQAYHEAPLTNPHNDVDDKVPPRKKRW